MRRMGFPDFTHKSAFLAVGRLTDVKTVDKNQAGILFLAWRCLYAELVRGRVDNVTPDLNIAYTRVISMNISRLKAYGERWLRWARKNKNTGNKSYIPERHQNKKSTSTRRRRQVRNQHDLLRRVQAYDRHLNLSTPPGGEGVGGERGEGVVSPRYVALAVEAPQLPCRRRSFR